VDLTGRRFGVWGMGSNRYGVHNTHTFLPPDLPLLRRYWIPQTATSAHAHTTHHRPLYPRREHRPRHAFLLSYFNDGTTPTYPTREVRQDRPTEEVDMGFWENRDMGMAFCSKAAPKAHTYLRWVGVGVIRTRRCRTASIPF
jgi:hypothetical protein